MGTCPECGASPQPEWKFCLKCGSPLPEGADYCPYCGVSLDISDRETFGRLVTDTDPLTGLHNRRYMMQEAEHHTRIYLRYRHGFSILLVGFANLKWVNDTFGHTVGESALKHLATLLRTNVRNVDITCRYGDDFVIIMPESEKQGAQLVGRRIADLATGIRLRIGRSFATMEVSFGTASCPEDGVAVEALLKVASAHRPPRPSPSHLSTGVTSPEEE